MSRHAVWLVVFLVSACQAAPRAEPVADLRALLAVLGLEAGDVTLRGDYVKDPDRLSLNGRLLSRPLEAEAEVHLMEGTLRTGLSGALSLAHETLSDTLTSIASPPHTSLLGALRLARLSVPTVRPAGDLFAMVHPESTLTQPELDHLLSVGRSVDVLAMIRATQTLVDAVESALDAMAKGDTLGVEAEMIVGTTGRDTFRHAAPVIFDPGGDDVYEYVGATSANQPVVVVIDLDGDDLYRGPAGVANGGIALLVDVSGDDRYEADGVSSQGVGTGGIGILWDRGGNDVYTGGPGSQGFGLLARGRIDPTVDATTLSGSPAPVGARIDDAFTRCPRALTFRPRWGR